MPEHHYVLPTADGGYIQNGDGSASFPAEQLALEGRDVMTVSEYKEFLRKLDISDDAYSINYSGFRAALPQSEPHVLWANQSYTSQRSQLQAGDMGKLDFFQLLLRETT
ncbi:hypothetical protein [Streptococcus marmotae]|uniref:hypothetical protein n=1 Tax=Streptococcus marmotae TaxID=1825069 RepID=UPI0008355726|nr:hypothetical protein [Streptococcus marmotae]